MKSHVLYYASIVMQICSVFYYCFCISAHTSNECIFQIHVTYAVIFLTATSRKLKTRWKHIFVRSWLRSFAVLTCYKDLFKDPLTPWCSYCNWPPAFKRAIGKTVSLGSMVAFIFSIKFYEKKITVPAVTASYMFLQILSPKQFLFS